MCKLSSLTGKVCGAKNPPGTETKIYYTCSCELNGFPLTRAELGGTLQGDTKILDEPFDFSTAPSSEGYWREATILVDTGDIKDVLEGEVGGQGYKSSMGFFIKGTNEEQLEFADTLSDTSGYLIIMLRDRNGKCRVLGNNLNPAFIESAEGGTGVKNGDRRGFAYVVSCSTGQTAPIYDDVTHGIDLTANP